jgi:ketosteroid isomerase-like protein
VANEQEIAAIILQMERAALDRWGKGDPSGFLEISAPDVVYFDPFQPCRTDGRGSLAQYYEGLRDQVHIDRDEIINPKVQVVGDTAVLTFNYVSWSGPEQQHWNCTEVYARRDSQWRIIQTHWSFTKA